MAASLRKWVGMHPHDGDFASQRMCPFCGLITPRHESCCLECGKALRPASRWLSRCGRSYPAFAFARSGKARLLLTFAPLFRKRDCFLPAWHGIARPLAGRLPGKPLILASNRRVDVTLSTTGQQSVREFPFNGADSLTLIKAEETKERPRPQEERPRPRFIKHSERRREHRKVAVKPARGYFKSKLAWAQAQRSIGSCLTIWIEALFPAAP